MSRHEPMEGARVVVVDDDPAMLEYLEVGLARWGFQVSTTRSADEVRRLVLESGTEAVVTDIRMPGQDGVALCRRLVEALPGLPVLVMTGFGSMDTAIAALRAGAYDFLTKPFELEVLVKALGRAVENRRLREEVRRLREEVPSALATRELVGASPASERLRTVVARLALSDATVLLSGETGAGKEVVARLLHQASARRSAPFVVLDCAAIPAGLLESELFGYRRGAFTDAREDRDGTFVRAHGGTLFLDEIGELPLDLQPKLLRAIEERRIHPLGGSDPIGFDVRIVAATHRDLEAEVAAGRFREDLFFRIQVVQVEVPPLRARGEDILPLAQHFLTAGASRAGKAIAGFTPETARRLLGYPWPGNVRELRNCMERAVALAEHDLVVVEDLPSRIREFRQSGLVVFGDEEGDLVPLAEMERRYVLRVLEAMQGNKTDAARVLGLDRKTLYRKLDRWEGREPTSEIVPQGPSGDPGA